MLPFVAKLLMSGQLSFENSKLSIFGERVLIIPLELILILVRESLKNEKLAKYVYDSAKQSVIGFCNNIQKKIKNRPERNYRHPDYYGIFMQK